MAPSNTINRAVNRSSRALGFGDFFSSAYRFLGFSILAALPYIIRNLDQVGARLQYESVKAFAWSLCKGLFLSFLNGILIAGSTVWYNLVHVRELITQVKIGTILYLLFVGTALVFTIYQPVKIIGGLVESSFNPFLAFGIALLVTVGFAGIAYYASDGATISSGVKGDAQVSAPVRNGTLNDTSPSYAPTAALDLNGAGA